MITIKLKKAQLLSNFKKQVDFDSIFVADSALYSQANLFLIKHLKWITRVPLSIKAAQFYVRETPGSEFIKTDREGYKAVEKAHRPRRGFLGVRTEQAESNYAGIKQKWIIIESKARKESDLKQLEKKILKDAEKANSLLSSLSKKKYENRTEIKAVFECKQKKLKYHNLVLKDVAKTTDKKTKKTVYKATIIFEQKSQKIAEQKKKAGRFILATNVLENLIPTGVKNQLGKLTDKPTLRWIFQCFQGIHLVVLNGVKQIVNLTDSRVETLNYFSKYCQKYYILSG